VYIKSPKKLKKLGLKKKKSMTIPILSHISYEASKKHGLSDFFRLSRAIGVLRYSLQPPI
jgi:hypothetical protein